MKLKIPAIRIPAIRVWQVLLIIALLATGLGTYRAYDTLRRERDRFKWDSAIYEGRVKEILARIELEMRHCQSFRKIWERTLKEMEGAEGKDPQRYERAKREFEIAQYAEGRLRELAEWVRALNMQSPEDIKRAIRALPKSEDESDPEADPFQG